MSLGVPSSVASAHRTIGQGGPLAIPLLFALALTLAYAVPFSAILWPFGDVYDVLLKADSLSWIETLIMAFREGVEYRPFFMLVVKMLYGTVGLHLWIYKLLVLLQFALILGVVIAILRPTGTARTIAALLAVGCIAGLHTSRILFSFFPLNHHSLTMLLVLFAAALALNGSGRLVEWLLPVVTLTALFFIEFGLLIPPVLTVLWLVKARGTTWRGVAGSWVVLAFYLAVRFGIGIQEELGLAHAETGIGFEFMELHDIEETFRHAPILFWGYNIVANVLQVLIAEPRNGVYYFVRSLLRDNTGLTSWFHVLSSAVTTACIGWTLARRSLGPRDRQLVALGIALLVCGGGLGLLYSRDRIGLPVGLGYAILLYVTVAQWLERPSTHALARDATAMLVVLLAAAWLVRDAEAWFQLRDTAWERRVEWTARFEELGGFKKPETELLERLKAALISDSVDDPRRDPPWTFVLVERRVKPYNE